MVDVADDSAMSHANIYRFFENKRDLVDALRGFIARYEDVCADVASRATPAKERLTDLVLELNRFKRRERSRNPRVHELLMMAIQEVRSYIPAEAVSTNTPKKLSYCRLCPAASTWILTNSINRFDHSAAYTTDSISRGRGPANPFPAIRLRSDRSGKLRMLPLTPPQKATLAYPAP
jgi:AcrR family transcriptional regulator